MKNNNNLKQTDMEFMRFIKLVINDENIINRIQKEYNNINKFNKHEHTSKDIIFRILSNNEIDINMRELYQLLENIYLNKLKIDNIRMSIIKSGVLDSLDKDNEIVILSYLNRDLHNKVESLISKINTSKNEMPIDDNIANLIKERDIKIQYLNDIKKKLEDDEFEFICTAAYNLNIIEVVEMSEFKKILPELYDELIKHLKPGCMTIKVEGGHIKGRINLINKVINDINYKYSKIMNDIIYIRCMSIYPIKIPIV